METEAAEIHNKTLLFWPQERIPLFIPEDKIA